MQGTVNQFFLDGTNLTLVSNTVNLNLWLGQQAIMEVENIGTPSAPVIRVDNIGARPRVMAMGELRLGQTTTLEVFAPAGSAAFIFLDFTGNTGFLPFPGGFGLAGWGTWLLGTSPHLHAFGVTTVLDVFQAPFTTPAAPTLIGLAVSSQAFVGDHGYWFFSNPDGSTVAP